MKITATKSFIMLRGRNEDRNNKMCSLKKKKKKIATTQCEVPDYLRSVLLV